MVDASALEATPGSPGRRLTPRMASERLRIAHRGISAPPSILCIPGVAQLPLANADRSRVHTSQH